MNVFIALKGSHFWFLFEISDIETRDIIQQQRRCKTARMRRWSAPLLFAYGINRFSHVVAQIMIIQRNNKMKFVHDYCECHRPCIFNDDILSSNIRIPLLSAFLSKKKKKEQKNKNNRKINTQKNCIDPETNQEPLDHQSCILPLHWCIRWRITPERAFLNNGDYQNYNLYWYFNDTE